MRRELRLVQDQQSAWKLIFDEDGAEIDRLKAAQAQGAMIPALAKLEKRRAHAGEQYNALAREISRLKDEHDAHLQKEHSDAEQFWFRRFHTSLAIAHGAAFVAIGSKAFEPALNADAKIAAAYALIWFGTGVVLAGVIPAVLFLHHQRAAWALAAGSAVAFVCGLATAIAAFVTNAGLVWPWQL